MLGFPTETREEIQATIDYAVKSDLAQAYFFNVVPQPGTPLYDLAFAENAAALESQTLYEYNAKIPWYTAAYGVDIGAIKKRAYVRFFVLSPKRWIMLIRGMPWKNFVMEFKDFLRFFVRKDRPDYQPLPEELQPLAQLHEPDVAPLTSAQTQRKVRFARSHS